MKVNDSEKIKILDFIACCDDFTKGKFLLVDSKVNNILKKIGESDALYDLFEDVLRNYNFEKEFSHAQIKFIGKPPKFEMPTEPFKILPLVFCMLVKIQDKSLDFASFLLYLPVFRIIPIAANKGSLLYSFKIILIHYTYFYEKVFDFL